MEFWNRRVRRIMPALLFMIMIVLTLSLFLFYKNEHGQIGKESLAALFSVANIFLWTLTRNYWGPQPESSMFLHTWSLSLEEQFYILFPILAVLILKFLPRLLPFITLLFAISGYIIYAITSKDHPQASFYLLPCRYWEIAIGSTTALIVNQINDLSKYIPKILHSIFSWTGLCLIVFSYFWLDNEKSLGWGLILPTIGAAIFILFASKRDNSANLILSMRPMIFIGKISYSLYLLHWPIIQFSKQFNFLPISIWFLILFILSYCSFKFIENPFRNNRKTIKLIGVAFILCATIALYLSNKNSFYDTSQFEKTVWKGFRYDVGPQDIEWSESKKLRMYGLEITKRPIADKDALYTNGITTNIKNNDKYPNLIVIGDSHALMWSPIIDEIGKEMNTTTIFWGMDAYFPFIRNYENLEVNNESKANIYDRKRVKSIIQNDCIVILCTRWSWNWRHFEYAKKMIDFVENKGSHTIIIEQPPELYFGDKNCPQYLSFLNVDPKINEERYIRVGNSTEYKKGTEAVHSLTESSNQCTLVSIKDLYLNDQGLVRVLEDRKVLYIDDDHLSYAGASIAKNRIEECLKPFIIK